MNKQYIHRINFIVILLFSMSNFHQSFSNEKQYFYFQNSPKSFKIDSSKLANALKLVNSYESKLKSKELNNELIIKDISLSELIHDFKRIIKYPNSNILGARGRYCGPATILNWEFNNRPKKYVQAAFELAYYGETRFSENSPKIKLAGVLHKIDYSIIDTIGNTFIRADIDSTSLPDFILGVSLVCSEKFIQKIGLLLPRATYDKYSVGSFIFSNTMPWEMNDYMRKMNIKLDDKGYYLGDKENIKNLKLLEDAVNQGKLPIIFDNHTLSFGRTQNRLYAFTGVHFITLHSFELDTVNHIVNYTYWDYGSVKANPYKRKDYRPVWLSSLKKQMKYSKKVANSRKPYLYNKEFSYKKFLKAMKGYWIPK